MDSTDSPGESSVVRRLRTYLSVHNSLALLSEVCATRMRSASRLRILPHHFNLSRDYFVVESSIKR